jgi:serine/threonine protein kinase
MCKEQEFMQLFAREIAIIKRVEHSNIVRTYDLFETDKKIHIVMEYMQGGMLFDAIEDGLKFTELDIAQLMREILHGVMYLHDSGIVHRDIKPENVLCTDRQPPWHVKLADFGLSKFMQNGLSLSDMLMQTMIGTPEFMSPEQSCQKECTSKVDIWAVGMLMYNVVTGRLPFDDNEPDVIGRLRNGLALTFPEKEWKYYSPDAKSFTRALLASDPNKRLTALAALVHPWLDSEKWFGASRFAPHGRFSQAPQQSPSDDNIICIEKSTAVARKSIFFGRDNAKKPSWLVAVITILALNRLMQLVRIIAPLVPTQKKTMLLPDLDHDLAVSDDDTDVDASVSIRSAFFSSMQSGKMPASVVRPQTKRPSSSGGPSLSQICSDEYDSSCDGQLSSKG